MLRRARTRSPAVIESTLRSEDSLMSVVPSIIVLMITALIVFRREITAGRRRRWPRAR